MDISNVVLDSKNENVINPSRLIMLRDKIEDLILSNRDLNIIFSQNKSIFLQDNLLDNIELSQSINNLYVYCKQVFPPRFFDIIYHVYFVHPQFLPFFS